MQHCVRLYTGMFIFVGNIISFVDKFLIQSLLFLQNTVCVVIFTKKLEVTFAVYACATLGAPGYNITKPLFPSRFRTMETIYVLCLLALAASKKGVPDMTEEEKKTEIARLAARARIAFWPGGRGGAEEEPKY